MGQVYEAVEEPSGRRVAIKTLRAELANDGEMLARFRNEARALITARHPGLVEVYETGSLPGGGAYIAMEFVDGQSLRRRLASGLPVLGAALRIGEQVASALAAVHSHGIVHRDLKPENIMLLRPSADAKTAPGRTAESVDPPEEPHVKVIDFGIAKVTTTTQRQTQLETRTGVIMGTPLYMAPEQCGGDGKISDRTDVYAMGCLLYELTCGHPPFSGETDSQIIGKHLFQPPLPLRQAIPTAPADLELLVHAMLTKQPEARPAMAEVASALRQLQAGKPLSATATRMLRLAREAATVRYRDVMTAQLGRPAAQRPNVLLLAVFGAMFVVLLATIFLRRSEPARVESGPPPPSTKSAGTPGPQPSAPPTPATPDPREMGRPEPGSPSTPSPRPKPPAHKKKTTSSNTPPRPPSGPVPPSATPPKPGPTPPASPPSKKSTKNTDIDLL